MSNAWRIGAVHHRTKKIRNIAIVYSEHMALRLQKYAGLWVNLTKDESIQVWQVELPEMLTDGDF
jgi:hypothetical protein|tara:strand:+ start:13583 stop:13777 length:195 start_codon:yes stop_codon:yes gene_type:complete